MQLTTTHTLPADVQRATDFEHVLLEEMFADLRYARGLNDRRVRIMAEAFDTRAVGVILLSLRPDGRYAIIDGNHRHAAAIVARHEHGRRDLDRLPARVYIDLTIEDEAALYQRFADVNKQTSYDVFKARLAAREPVATTVALMLGRYGLAVAQSTSDQNRVGATSALLDMYAQLGPGSMDECIGILHAAWGGDPRAYSSMALGGMTLFWKRYRTLVDRRRLIERMKQTTALDVVGQVHSWRAHHKTYRANAAWGEIILEQYNTGLRTRRLPPWQQIVFSDEGRAIQVETGRQALSTRTPEQRSAVTAKGLATRRAMKSGSRVA